MSSMQHRREDGETGTTYHFDKADGRFGVLTVYGHCMEWEVFDRDPNRFTFARKIDYKDQDLRPCGMDWADYTNKPVGQVVEARRMTLLDLVQRVSEMGYQMRNYYITDGTKTYME